MQSGGLCPVAYLHSDNPVFPLLPLLLPLPLTSTLPSGSYASVGASVLFATIEFVDGRAVARVAVTALASAAALHAPCAPQSDRTHEMLQYRPYIPIAHPEHAVTAAGPLLGMPFDPPTTARHGQQQAW